MSLERRLARKLRLAMVKNAFTHGEITEIQAKGLLAGCLTPGDEDTRIDDSNLLSDPLALQKIDVSDPDWSDPWDGRLTPPTFA